MTNMLPEKTDNELLSVMLNELQTLNKIAVLKEESFVIKNIFLGKTKKYILDKLNEKYPNDKITLKDLNDFLILYRDELMIQKEDIEKGYVRRLIKSKEGLNNELIKLAIKAKDMSDKYDAEQDNSNAVAALRTAADIFMKFAKVEGLTNDMPEVNINMQMDKVVSEVTSKSSEFKDRILKIMEESNNENEEKEEKNIIDAEFKDGK